MKPPYDHRLIGVADVCRELQCSRRMGYEIIRAIQKELVRDGYYVVKTFIPWTELYDKYNLWKPNEREQFR